MENDSPGKWWKIAGLKMAEKAPPENGGMENDRPRKLRKFIGLENGGKCLTGKWWNGK